MSGLTPPLRAIYAVHNDPPVAVNGLMTKESNKIVPPPLPPNKNQQLLKTGGRLQRIPAEVRGGEGDRCAVGMHVR